MFLSFFDQYTRQEWDLGRQTPPNNRGIYYESVGTRRQ
jgi:hypothetical protein